MRSSSADITISPVIPAEQCESRDPCTINRSDGGLWVPDSRFAASGMTPELLPRSPLELAGAQLTRELVEHRVDHAGFVLVEECVRHVDIFLDDNARRYIRARREFECAGAQHRAQQCLDTLQGPAAGQRLVDHRIELALIVEHTAHHAAEERRLSGQILRALDLPPDPVALELGQDLVERLHGGEPRRAAAVCLAIAVGGRRRFHRRLRASRMSLRFSRTNASAARAAPPPLSSPVRRARARACASVSTVRMPLPIGMSRAMEISMMARADSPATMS